MKRSALFLISVFILLCAPAARSEERRMTLDDSLRAALLNALEIREGRHGPPIARTRVEEADADFDHLLSFRTSGGKASSPTGTRLSGADELREQRLSFEAGIDKRLRSGGSYGLVLRAGDLMSNSSFYTLRPQWTTSLTLSVTHPLLRTAGGEYALSPVRIAEIELEGANQDYRGILNATLAAVERAYWNLVFLREDLEVKMHSQRVSEELLRISRRRKEAGAGTRIEVVQAQAGVAEREKEVILAENRVLNAEDLLRSFVFPFADRPEDEIRIIPLDTVGKDPVPGEESLEERLRVAFESRPDVLALKESLEASGVRVRQSENELLPRLDVFGSVGTSGLDDDVVPSTGMTLRSEFPAWEVGLSLELPLGNRAAEARYRRARLERSRLLTTFKRLRNRVMMDVRTAVRSLETAAREITAAKRATAAAQAQFEAETDRLKAEKSTNWQLLQVEQDLSRARSQELLSLVGHKLARVDLEEATGTYLASRGFSVPAPRVPERDLGR